MEKQSEVPKALLTMFLLIIITILSEYLVASLNLEESIILFWMTVGVPGIIVVAMFIITAVSEKETEYRKIFKRIFLFFFLLYFLYCIFLVYIYLNVAHTGWL